MKAQVRIGVATALFGLLVCGATARTRDKKEAPNNKKVVIWVYKVKGDLQCEINAVRHAQNQCGFVLGELRLTHDKDTQIVLLISEDAELSTIGFMGKKAVEAGFRNVQAYIQWKKTGRVAEIQFGPVSDPGSVTNSK